MPRGVFFRIRVYLSILQNILLHTFMDTIIKYLKETKAELKEVTFPSTSQTITYTVIVVAISMLVAVTLGVTDFGLREALTKFLAR